MTIHGAWPLDRVALGPSGPEDFTCILGEHAYATTNTAISTALTTIQPFVVMGFTGSLSTPTVTFGTISGHDADTVYEA